MAENDYLSTTTNLKLNSLNIVTASRTVEENEDVLSVHQFNDELSYVALFDGTYSNKMAICASEKLHGFISDSFKPSTSIPDSIVSGFLKFNFQEASCKKHTWDGSCAIGAIMDPENIYLFNLGSSSAIYVKDDKIVQKTTVRTIDDEEESTRIYAAIGEHECWLYSLTRGLGFFDKQKEGLSQEKQPYSPVPDVITIKRESGNSYLVLACKYIWKYTSEETVREIVSSMLLKNDDLESIANAVIEKSMNNNACSESAFEKDLSVIIIKLW